MKKGIKRIIDSSKKRGDGLHVELGKPNLPMKQYYTEQNQIGFDLLMLSNGDCIV